MNLLFFKFSVRNILRNKLNSFINVIGLSIGIATTLFILLFLDFETGFDTFHPEGEKLFRIVLKGKTQNGIITNGFCWYPVASEIKNEISGIDDFCRVSPDNKAKLNINQQVHSIDKFRFVDENFFQFFKFDLVIGNPKTVLSNSNSMVLSRKTAQKIFGKKNPIGETIIFNQKVFTITGVAEDLPLNTHLMFDVIASNKFVEQDKENYWLGWKGGMDFLSYLKLTKGVKPEKIESLLPAFMDRKLNNAQELHHWEQTPILQKIKDVHLMSGDNHYDNADNRNRNSLFIVSSICILILVLAIFNYISLYLAQKSNKIKDLSLLKIHGANKIKLTIQTFIEILILSAISSIFGAILLNLFLPFLNNSLQTSVSMSQNYFKIFSFLLIIIFTISILITLLSMSLIFKVKAIEALKETTQIGGHRKIWGSSMVSFQFIVMIMLIISSFFISQQNNYILNKELGFDKQNILSISSDHEFKQNELLGFKQDLQAFPEITNTCLTSEQPGSGLTTNGYILGGQNSWTTINVLYTDADFLNCFGVQLVSGRKFNEDISTEKSSVLVNQQLVKKTNWNNPIGQKIIRSGELQVIGTVEDFNFAPLDSKIDPLIIMVNPAWDGWGYYYVNIKYKTTNIQSLIAKIGLLWQKRFPDIPYEIVFLDDNLALNYQSLISQQKLVVFFNSLSILIACLGLFGLTSLVTTKRTKEIGIRKINGAKTLQIVMMLNKDLLKWVAIAFVIACPIAWYAMHKWLENFAYKTELSWWIFALAGMLAFVVALLTVSWQSWRAATRNPVESLRYE